jgi:hypothetical protein
LIPISSMLISASSCTFISICIDTDRVVNSVGVVYSVLGVGLTRVLKPRQPRIRNFGNGSEITRSNHKHRHILLHCQHILLPYIYKKSHTSTTRYIMTENTIADDYFQHLTVYALAVCKECRHRVLPSQVKSHLQRTHRIKSKQAELAAEEVSSWAGLIEYASEVVVPSQIVEPTNQLL